MMPRIGRLLVVVVLLCLCSLEGVHALTAGSGPSSRTIMGLKATPDGMLYVFGGGNERGDGNEP
jgi:hypothetical protein